MAILRSRGGRSLTTRPPMRMSPLVCRSSPAIMRRSVVLPPPLGPRSPRNSPSWVCKSTPSTAVCSWKIFRISFVSTVATGGASRKEAGETSTCEVSPGSTRTVSCPLPARLEQLALLPLCEDVAGLRLRFLDRVLGAHHALGRLGEHVVQDPLAVDVVDGGVGVARVAHVGRPVERVGEHRVLVGRLALRVLLQEL